MANKNSVLLIGRLGKDPQVRTLENGVKVANFSMATSHFYKGKDGQRVEETDWHSIVVWRRGAEIAEKYFTKGKEIVVEGRLKTRSYEVAGVTNYITEVIATSVQMSSGGSGNGKTSDSAIEQEQGVAVYEGEDVDDLPF